MLLQFTDAEIQTKAEQLGLVTAGEKIPSAAMHSRVKAALVAERRAGSRVQAAVPQLAQEIVVQPGGPILIDGEPFPWLIAKDPMDIRLAPGTGDVSTVRLTLMASTVQIIKPEEKKEDPS